MGEDRHLDAEQRRDDERAEERSVALVVRVRDERDAAGEQFRAGGVDVDGAGVVGAVEGDAVIGAGPFAVLEFGLGDGGSKVDVPERGCLGGVDLFARQHLQEGALADRLGLFGDRGVLVVPVDADADGAPQLLKGLFVARGEFEAEFDEVLARDGDLVLRGLLGRSVLRVVGE